MLNFDEDIQKLDVTVL